MSLTEIEIKEHLEQCTPEDPCGICLQVIAEHNAKYGDGVFGVAEIKQRERCIVCGRSGTHAGNTLCLEHWAEAEG